MKTVWIVTCIILTLLVATVVQALPVVINQVEIGGADVSPNGGETLDVQRGQELPIRIELTATEDAEDISVWFLISTIEGDPISETVGPFTLRANRKVSKHATLRIPGDIILHDYKLRVMVAGADGDDISSTYDLDVTASRHDVEIIDVLDKSGSRIRAGDAYIVSYRIANIGYRDENNVRVTATLPQLGLTQRGFIDEIEAVIDDEVDHQEETEEFIFRIPTCTPAGTYTVNVNVRFDRGRKELDQSYDIDVVESDLCKNTASQGPTTSIVISNDIATVKQGEETVFSIALTNNVRERMSYTLRIRALEGVEHRITPTAALIIPSKETRTLHLFTKVSEDLPIGPHSITLEVHKSNQLIQEIPLTLNVQENKKESTVGTLGISLIVIGSLLVIMVIVIALLHLSKRSSEDNDGSSYY